MSSIETQPMTEFPVAHMAEHLIGSEIIKLANDVNEKIREGAKIYNFTIGDFDPAIFPIPVELKDEIIRAYQEGHTNYPVANGMLDLRKAILGYMDDLGHPGYSADEILVAGGARPLIYAIYTTLLDPGDKVIYPVPSWNNNHYCHLTRAQGIQVDAYAADNFMLNAEAIRPFIKEAQLLALCSPQNPTGTVFSKEQLTEICALVLEENKRRSPCEKPLYIMYDQIYSALTYGKVQHYDPVTLFPELRPYTVFVDGISKAFAATGIRVGWSAGPSFIIDKMKSILSHIGAWSPKAEQVATARFLTNKPAIAAYFKHFKSEVEERLITFYKGFCELQAAGHPVQCIEPMAAIYLTIQLELKGKRLPDGEIISSTRQITEYMLNEVGLAIVPFSAFGADHESTWYRVSVGTCHKEQMPEMFGKLKVALERLQ